ncbi:MAG: hypothetical protein ACRBF0_22340 [Calditrichia bacterium]
MKQPLLLTALLFLLACGGYETESPSTEVASNGVQFVKTSFDETTKMAADKQKMMMLDFFAVW